MGSSNAQLEVDVSIIPWSHRGSYLSLSTKGGLNGVLTPGTDVCLISQCRPTGLPLFALRPLPAGEKLGPPSGFHRTPSPTTFHATPSRLEWKYQGSVVAECTFQHVRCLRFRGPVPLALDSEAAVDGGAFIFSRPHWPGSSPTIEYALNTMKGYRFVAIKGRLTAIHGDDPKLLNRRVQIEGDDGDPSWELLVCEAETAHVSSEATSYDTCDAFTSAAKSHSFDATVDRMEAALEDFTQDLCPWSSPAPTRAERLAAYVTWTSMVRPGGHFAKEAVLMSKLWMNKVWSWDNCINAVGVAPLSMDLAIDQIRIPYGLQTADGRLPDSVDWLCIEWAYTKPPIEGWTLLKLLELEDPRLDDKVLLELYHGTAKFTDFWMRHRRTDKSALPWYCHGNDSGWDNSTAFDEQPVIVSPDCAAYLIVQADVLGSLALRLGLPQQDADGWTQLKTSLTEALVDELWDGDSFLVKNALTGATRKTTSLIRLMPLAAARHLPRHIVDKMAADLSARHLTEWGPATEEVGSPLYEPDGYWRGPIWAPTTLLIESGLRAAGRTEVADAVSGRFMKLCEKAGFAENYDAVEGRGLRDLSYTWASSVYLTLVREDAARRKRASV